jgi:hypothetical protein
MLVRTDKKSPDNCVSCAITSCSFLSFDNEEGKRVILLLQSQILELSQLFNFAGNGPMLIDLEEKKSEVWKRGSSGRHAFTD